jgi:hypothetical protein
MIINDYNYFLRSSFTKKNYQKIILHKQVAKVLYITKSTVENVIFKLKQLQ